MYENLPPLKTIQFFEAVARHSNFSKAAEELFVTQSAVSYQIHQLEEFLGKKLFVRQGKLISLTDEGKLYYPVSQRLLSTLDGVTAKLKNRMTGVTKFLVYSSFALKWLVPRLSQFRSMHPEIDLRLEMNTEIDAPLIRKQVDCGITINTENTDFEYVHLISEEKVIVCSPQLVQDRKKISLEELCKINPLLVSDDMNEWEKILTTFNYTIPKKQYYFSHAILMQQAAIEGQGLALCAESIVKSDINAGLLIKVPFETNEKLVNHFYFCVEKNRFNEPAIQSLLNWLKSCF